VSGTTGTLRPNLYLSNKGPFLKISRLAACSLVAVLAYSSVVSIASAAPPGTPQPLPDQAHLLATKAHVPASAVARSQSDGSAFGAGRSAPVPSAAAPHLAAQLQAIAGIPGAAANGLGKVRVEKDGTTVVTVSGSGAANASKSVGAWVLATSGGLTTMSVAPNQLQQLAKAAGVELVQPAKRAYVQVAPDEGVAASGASSWISGGTDGSGIKVAIVDSGFGDLGPEVAAGRLPAGLTVIGDHCGGHVNDSSHGTAVAEVVHQMAPGATLFLYCVLDNVGFAQAASELQAQGVKIVNSSLGFVGESRGDGGGIDMPGTFVSTSVTVKKARRAGVLWVQAAGNSAQDHWSGTFTDANRDGWVDLQNTGSFTDAVELAPREGGLIQLSWDAWPPRSANQSVSLQVLELDQNGDPVGSATIGSPDPALPNLPDRGVEISNTSADYHAYLIRVGTSSSLPTTRYDLSYVGQVSPSYLSDGPFWSNPTADATRAAGGSVLDPASSPYALAVGAVNWNGQNLEPFSSRGPTSDGRVKPDLLGFDGTSSAIYGDAPAHGFYGTSAAAPHVAGAAALVKAANSTMDAAQIQAFLEGRATQNASPPTNTVGHGVLNLGANSNVAPVAGSGYFALPNPVRIADTRTGLGGVPKTIMGTGAAFQVVVPNSLVPSDATAVVLNISGVGARGSTFLSVYSGPNWGGNSTLNLNALDANATVAAIVKLNVSHAFFVRNQLYWTHAVVTLAGYFGAPTAGGLGYKALPSNRLLDTRTSIGGHQRKLAVNEIVTVQVANRFGVPANATAAVVNMTALNQTAGGYLTAYPYAPTGVASVDYHKYSRSNLVIVPLSGGNFSLGNRFASTDAMVDIVGYFGGTAATAKFVPLPNSVRIVDTRNGNGGYYGTLAANYAVSEDAGGLNGVPYEATGVWIGITAIASGSGYVTIYPNGTVAPHASNLDYTPGRVVPNAGIATLSAPTATVPPGFSTVNRFGLVNLLEDVYGYFSG
jgi:hypothetical protein